MVKIQIILVTADFGNGILGMENPEKRLFKVNDYPGYLKFNVEDGKAISVVVTRDNLDVEISLIATEN